MTRTLPVLLLLAACGSGAKEAPPGFAGTYAATTPTGDRVTLTLRQDGTTLTGTAQVHDVQAVIEGIVEGDRVTGTVRQPEMGVQAKFEATLKGDTLDWTYRFETDMGEQLQPLTFRRTKQVAVTKEEAPKGPTIDPQLVGRWYTEVGGTGASGNTVTTRIHVYLGPEGTFEYGGAESLITLRKDFDGPGDVSGAGPAGTTKGEWKTEANVLHCRVAGGDWTPLGRYVLSGNDLVLYTANGGKQLWSRE